MQPFDPNHSLSTSLDHALDILRSGGVIGIPTDTVYGIAANALDERAVDRVFRIKGRDDSSPIPVLVSCVEDLFRYGTDVSAEAISLARAFWPGQITIVVCTSGLIPSAVTGGRDTVGLRVADHAVPRHLSGQLGTPITATSANLSGAEPLTTAVAVARDLGQDLDLVFDGGQLAPSKPSTVVDATVRPVRILREGAVSRRAIERVTGATCDM